MARRTQPLTARGSQSWTAEGVQPSRGNGPGTLSPILNSAQDVSPIVAQQQQAKQGDNPGEDLSLLSGDISVNAQGRQLPPIKNEAREERTGRRDRWGQEVEILTLIVG